MDNNTKKKFIIVIIGSILVFFIIAVVIDQCFNRMVASWVVNHYFETGTDQFKSVEMIFKWNILKRDIIILGIFILVFTIICSFIIYYYTKLKYQKEINKELIGIIDKIERGEKIQKGLNNGLENVVDDFNRIEDLLIKQKKDMDREIEKKNELIAYLAHDIRTPLTSIIGYLRILQDDANESNTKDYVNKILKYSYRLEYMINEFFDIARFNIKAVLMKLEKVNLCCMMIQILEELYPILKEKNINVRTNIDESLDIIVAPELIARVFNNILKNATTFCFENSEIEVSVQQKNDVVEIEIANQGEKISATDLQNIFEKFYRVDQARGTKNGGAGLGLAIAKEIVEQHHGYIYAISDEQWTRFRIILPIKRELL